MEPSPGEQPFADFDAFEASTWERQAAGYDGFFPAMTAQAAGPLLDAAAVGPGARLLDLATGPGVVARAAVARGAHVVGLDVAEAMLAIARVRCPPLGLCRADGHHLPFAAGSFDAVTANFAVLHMGRPDDAAAEAAWALVPGGTLAVTVWGHPEEVAIFDAFQRALAACEAPPTAGVPEGPPFFRYSDEAALTGLLEGAGLAEVSVTTLAFTHEAADAEQVWQALVHGTVRTAALVASQGDRLRQAVHDAFVSELEAHRRGGRLALAAAVRMGTGRAQGRPVEG